MLRRYGVALLATIASCQQGDRPTPKPAPATSRTASQRSVVDGLVIEHLEGGSIEIAGKDRWGNAFDTTYESSEYLRKALPVLARSLTPEQVSRLGAIAGREPDARELRRER
jgi:hypothetical protein